MKKALIVIDMINDFLHEEGSLYIGPTGRDIINPIIDKISKNVKDGPVFFVSDSHESDDPEFDRFPKHAVKGTWGSRIIKELGFISVSCSSLINKTTFDVIKNTGLLPVLRYYSIDTVEIVGCCTSICVGVSAINLKLEGLDVEISKSCVADYNQEAHDFYLNHLEVIHGVKITV